MQFPKRHFVRFDVADAHVCTRLRANLQREHSDYRTSKNSWLMGKFMTDPVVTTVDARIANLTGLFAGNSEHYQCAWFSRSFHRHSSIGQGVTLLGLL